MYNWEALTQVLTSTGQPRQFFNEDGAELFMAAYERVSGPGDEKVPRRVVGTGVTRKRALASAHIALSRYDSTYSIIPSQ